ncbi:hypothetical protein ACOMHN_067273 [Nucella lapillus]
MSTLFHGDRTRNTARDKADRPDTKGTEGFKADRPDTKRGRRASKQTKRTTPLLSVGETPTGAPKSLKRTQQVPQRALVEPNSLKSVRTQRPENKSHKAFTSIIWRKVKDLGETEGWGIPEGEREDETRSHSTTIDKSPSKTGTPLATTMSGDRRNLPG